MKQDSTCGGQDAVKVAICYGWIDSTVKSLGDREKKAIIFCPENQKSV